MKKSDYTRSTAEWPFPDLHRKFHKYLKEYAGTHNLENIEHEVLRCFITTNSKKGFFGRIKTNFTVICLTKRFLFWGIIEDEKETGIGAARWEDISEIRDWEKTEMGKFVEESGVELHGFMYMASHRSTWFIGLGKDDAGSKCRDALKEMIKKER